MYSILHHILELVSNLGFLYVDQVFSFRGLCRSLYIHPIPICKPEMHARVHSDQGCYYLSRHFASFPNKHKSPMVLYVYATWITKEGLRFLSKLHLKALHLKCCNTVSEESLYQLPKTLERLILSHCPCITTLPPSFASHLVVLRIQECHNITEPHRFLPKYTLLRKFEISSFRASDAWVMALPASPRLKIIILKHSHCLTDYGLQHLVLLPNVTSLELTRCTKITHASFPYIALLPLRKLVLRKCSLVTDQALPHIRTMHTLHELHVLKCNQITAEGLIKLQWEFEEIRIINKMNKQRTHLYTPGSRKTLFIEQEKKHKTPANIMLYVCLLLPTAALFFMFYMAHR